MPLFVAVAKNDFESQLLFIYFYLFSKSIKQYIRRHTNFCFNKLFCVNTWRISCIAQLRLNSKKIDRTTTHFHLGIIFHVLFFPTTTTNIYKSIFFSIKFQYSVLETTAAFKAVSRDSIACLQKSKQRVFFRKMLIYSLSGIYFIQYSKIDSF